jgi:RNA polymerase sigma factor (sigma-70 family)
MAKATLSAVIGRLVSAQARSGPADRQLLERFIAHKDEAAFAALVQRHGPMVLAVARNVLHHRQDAEDVFQATFLVLARKAASVRKRGSAGSWLHGVAYRLALKARTAAAARHRLESRAPARAPEESADDLTWRELSRILHEELDRLPDKYRAPLVLCYLQGLTQDQAAEHLGLPKGTLRGRLERGRLLLRGRLSRRGLAPAVVLLADTTRPTAAALAGPLVSTTARTAAAYVAGRAAGVSVPVAHMTEEVLRAMFITQLRSAAAVLLLAIGLVAAAAGVLAARCENGDRTPRITGPVPVFAPEPPAPARPEGPGPGPDTGAKPGADTGQPIRSLAGHKDRLTAVAYSPDDRWIGTASWDGTARLWDARTGEEVRRLDVPAPRDYHPAHLSRILFSPDNHLVVVAQQAMPNEAGVIVWDRRTGKKVRDFPGGTGSVAVSRDGKLIACGGYGVIRLYDLATGKPVREMRSQQTHISTLTFLPDGKTLFETGPPPTPQRGDGIERLTLMADVGRFWDVATGKQVRSPLDGVVLGGHLAQCAALSPDGRTLAARTSLLETATGGGRALLVGHSNGVDAVAFTPDGRTLASGSMDGTVRLWDLPSGKEVGRLGKEVPQFAGRGWVLAVAFSPDGRTLVAGGLDRVAQVWDVSRTTGRRRPVAERSPAELEADWRDLAGNPAVAYAALGRLVSSPRGAVAFLGEQLRRARPVDVAQLIARLDDARFQAREQATRELAALGDLAAPALRKALAAGPGPETRRRLAALLNRLDGARPSPETARQIRAVEALEAIPNPAARRLLDRLAAGPAGTRLEQEAKASVARLARRATPVP